MHIKGQSLALRRLADYRLILDVFASEQVNNALVIWGQLVWRFAIFVASLRVGPRRDTLSWLITIPPEQPT
jgi:hypothetical protein